MVIPLPHEWKPDEGGPYHRFCVPQFALACGQQVMGADFIADNGAGVLNLMSLCAIRAANGQRCGGNSDGAAQERQCNLVDSGGGISRNKTVILGECWLGDDAVVVCDR